MTERDKEALEQIQAWKNLYKSYRWTEKELEILIYIEARLSALPSIPERESRPPAITDEERKVAIKRLEEAIEDASHYRYEPNGMGPQRTERYKQQDLGALRALILAPLKKVSREWVEVHCRENIVATGPGYKVTFEDALRMARAIIRELGYEVKVAP